jgi:predicted lipoprotein with Yx(FWY)xxD motif
MNSLASKLVAVLLLTSGQALAGAPGPSVAIRGGIGRCLVDGAGRTLYVFKKDSPGQSACQGDCVARWPAYFNDGGTPSGVDVKDLGTITRADGRQQTTYKGMPLYTFAADAAPGDVKGQGLKEVWFVAVP